MSDQTRPEPVLDEARVIKTLGLVLGAVVVILGLFGVVVSAELVSRITTAITVAVGAGVAVWSLIGPMVRARRLRAQVTPVADPRAADGTPLVPAGPAAAEPAEGTTVTLPDDGGAPVTSGPGRFDEEPATADQTPSLGEQWDRYGTEETA